MTAELGHVSSSKKLSGAIELIDASGGVVSSPYITTDITDVTVRVPIYLTREIPLAVEYKFGFFNSGNAKVTLTPEAVSVKGEVEAVNELEKIVVTTIDEKLAQNGKTTVVLTLPDGITVTDGTESVEVGLTLRGLVTKTVAVTNINVKNPSGYTYIPVNESCNITVRGSAEDIAAITEENISIVVDISAVTSATKSISAAAEIVIDSEYSNTVHEVGQYTVQLER